MPSLALGGLLPGHGSQCVPDGTTAPRADPRPVPAKPDSDPNPSRSSNSGGGGTNSSISSTQRLPGPRLLTGGAATQARPPVTAANGRSEAEPCK